MLDAFIIEKIQRDSERAEQGRRLQIEKRPPPAPDAWQERRQQRIDEDIPERGVVVIDFRV